MWGRSCVRRRGRVKLASARLFCRFCAKWESKNPLLIGKTNFLMEINPPESTLHNMIKREETTLGEGRESDISILSKRN